MAHSSHPLLFPRQNDGHPPAWGLRGARPYLIWERFSPAYETQAERLWHACAALGLTPALEWAGSEEGEALLGRDAAGEIALLLRLEEPDEAQRLQAALCSGQIRGYLRGERKALRDEVARHKGA